MDLPRALEPWRERLSIFPQDLAIALGGIVDPLALLIGPMLSPDAAGRGEPDGIGGIGRRGPFERLLATEWALAEHAPLEFLRRVSTGELSFLEISHQRPTVARQSIVLFDVGPDQRGGPRVVHLAVLILLAQRAFAGGASFSWGLLQDEPCELYSDVNEESVRRLVQARSNRRPKTTDVERWHEALNKSAPEMWIVGGQNIENVRGETISSLVQIDDSFDPNEPWDVSIKVCSPDKKPRSVSLPLPVASQSVRLIRDPFHVAKATQKKTSRGLHPDTNIIFARNGKLLFVRGANGELLTIPIPNSPNVPDPPKPRIFVPPDGQVLVGVGQLSTTNRIAAVTQTAHAFFVHTLSKRSATTAQEEKFVSAAGDMGFTSSELGQLGVLHGIDDWGFFFHDGFVTLYSLKRQDLRADFEPQQVLSAFQDGSDYYYCRMDDDDLKFIVRRSAKVTNECALPGHRGESSDVLVGPATIVIAHGTTEAIIVSNTDGKPLGSRKFPPSAEVLGVKLSNNPAIVLVDDSRTRICSIDQDGETTWFTAPGRMRTAAAIHGCWLIAFITEDDELCVYSHEHKTLILRLRMEAA